MILLHPLQSVAHLVLHRVPEALRLNVSLLEALLVLVSLV